MSEDKKAFDWVFSGAFTETVTVKGKKLLLKSLNSQESVEVSQKAKMRVGDDYDREFLTQLFTVGKSVIEIDGKPTDEEELIEELFKTPEVIVRYIYGLYLKSIVSAVRKTLDAVKN